jgi:hemimethylated DNA binding protein
MSLFPQAKPLTSVRALWRALIQESDKSKSLPHYIPREVLKTAFKNPSSSPVLGIAALSELRFRNIIYKGTDTEPPLSPKAVEIKFSIGQVLFHKITREKMIVVAYDKNCKASKEWQATRVSNPNQTFYTCLVDVRDCSHPTIVYVAQDHLLTAKEMSLQTYTKLNKKVSSIGSSNSIKVSSGPSASVPSVSSSIGLSSNPPLVLHPSLPNYFSMFSPPGQYIMKSSLMELYPHDAIQVPLVISIEARAKAMLESLNQSNIAQIVDDGDNPDNDGVGSSSSSNEKRLI